MSTKKDLFTKSMKKNNLEESANLQLTKHQTRVEPNLETHGTKKVEKRVSSPVPKKVALVEDEMKSDTVTHSVTKSPSSKAVVSCFVYSSSLHTWRNVSRLETTLIKHQRLFSFA